MNRREMLLASGAACLGLSTFPLRWAAAQSGSKQRILYFTRSAGFEHSVVRRANNELSHSEKVFTQLGQQSGFDVVCSKDGRLFDGDLDQFDCIVFYTSGDLTRPVEGRDEPAMSAEGKRRLLDAVAAGKGFVGIHAATDSFRGRFGPPDPYIAMLGGEFIVHGPQQSAKMRVASPQFPGIRGLGEGYDMHEEWYASKNFAPDLHVILVQETQGMTGDCYQRPPFPATWARKHEKGRVFYTSMGHREDIWTGKIFQQVLLGGLGWAMRNVDFEPTPNLKSVTPQAEQLHG
jgi:type 1 glutamine amidotransferase